MSIQQYGILREHFAEDQLQRLIREVEKCRCKFDQEVRRFQLVRRDPRRWIELPVVIWSVVCGWLATRDNAKNAEDYYFGNPNCQNKRTPEEFLQLGEICRSVCMYESAKAFYERGLCHREFMDPTTRLMLDFGLLEFEHRSTIPIQTRYKEVVRNIESQLTSDQLLCGRAFDRLSRLERRWSKLSSLGMEQKYWLVASQLHAKESKRLMLAGADGL